MIKIYRLNDYEWYAGETLEECVKFAIDMTGLDEEDVLDGPLEIIEPLTQEQMVKTIFVDEDGTKISFTERLQNLIDNGEEFPQFFATTEW